MPRPSRGAHKLGPRPWGACLAILRQLLQPSDYRASDWDLKSDAAGRESWVKYFLDHAATLLAELRKSYPDANEQRIAAFRGDYATRFESIASHPDRYPRIDVLELDRIVNAVLADHGFRDPYLAMKSAADAAALPLFAQVCIEIDSLPVEQQFAALLRGLLAGNLFDVGAPAAMQRHAEHEESFARTRDSLPQRPWRFDDGDEFATSLLTGSYEHVAFFVDNAGGGTILGSLPLARWLLARGRRVSLCANSAPALNDITAAELDALLGAAPLREDGILGRALAENRLRVVPSGSVTPLLDLTQLSPGCVQDLADADLIMLHGMGRSIESNWLVRLSCSCTHSAILKDARVAERVGASLFDCVFRYRPRP